MHSTIKGVDDLVRSYVRVDEYRVSMVFTKSQWYSLGLDDLDGFRE